jgi:filamentous hemagglutinin family protein
MGGALIASLGDCAFAQIVPDTTLGSENSSVTPMTPTVDQINGGATRGTNLFHSFQEFNVGEGRSVYFTTPAGIDNILTRVTGANPSNILGALGVTGGDANLFLINPNGIIFGQNARLDVGGSFLASTASSLNFADGTQFSATAPQTTPLLTVSVPIGLQFVTTAGSIRNESQATNSSGKVVGLQVQPGKTLALVGGDVSLDGWKLQAPGGRVELAGVAGSATVGLSVDGNNIDLSFADGVALSDVSLTNGAEVNVRGGGGGSIAINARSLNISGDTTRVGAGIDSGLGSIGSMAGDIEINATEATNIDVSVISNEVLEGGTGNGGDINITSGSLRVSNGAQLIASTFGQGKAGSVIINARDTVAFDGVDSNGFSSAAYSNVEGTGIGDGGDINITSGSLRVSNGAQLVANTFGQGKAGSVIINTRDTVAFDGVGSNGASSAAYSNVEGTGIGDGGDINITSGSLRVSNGAQLVAATFGQGKAGSVIIVARDTVAFDGVRSDGFSSGAFTTVRETGIGDGGDINITTGSLRVSNAAVVSARTRGQGNGGNIIVHANILEAVNGGQVITTSDFSGKAGDIILNVTQNVILSGSDPTYSARLAQFGFEAIDNVGSASGVFANTLNTSTNRGGDLTITTGQLNVRDGAEVSVSSQGVGNAGALRVEANSISLDNGGKLRASTASGLGGNIELQVQDLILMRLHSLISTNAENNGSGGNVTINAPFIVAVPGENSDIIANAEGGGQGGNINITTQGIYGLEYRPQLTPNSDINASSRFGVNGTVQINTPGIDPSRGLANLPTEVVDASNQIAQTCGAGRGEARKNEFIVTGRRGLPSNPYETLSDERALEDVKPPSGFNSSRNSKPDAAKTVTSQSATSNPKPPIVEAQGWVINDKGQVVLTATAPTVTPHNSGLGSATCPSS